MSSSSKHSAATAGDHDTFMDDVLAQNQLLAEFMAQDSVMGNTTATQSISSGSNITQEIERGLAKLSLETIDDALPPIKRADRRTAAAGQEKPKEKILAPALAWQVRGRMKREAELARRKLITDSKTKRTPLGNVSKDTIPEIPTQTLDVELMDLEEGEILEDPTEPKDNPYWSPISSEYLSKRCPKNPRCALQTNDGPVIGSPYELQPGWKVHLALRVGLKPYIALRFKFNKAGEHETPFLPTNEMHQFAIAWYPGVRFGSKWMMESFVTTRVTDQIGIHSIAPPEFLGVATESDKVKLDKLIYLSFDSNDFVTFMGEERTAYPQQCWEGLDQKVVDVVNSIFRQTSFSLGIWFVAPSANYADARLSYFKDFYNLRYPGIDAYIVKGENANIETIEEMDE